MKYSARDPRQCLVLQRSDVYAATNNKASTVSAKKFAFKLTRRNEAGVYTAVVPPNMALQPGDTIAIGERWF